LQHTFFSAYNGIILAAQTDATAGTDDIPSKINRLLVIENIARRRKKERDNAKQE